MHRRVRLRTTGVAALAIGLLAGVGGTRPAAAEDVVGRSYRVADHGEARQNADEYSRRAGKGEWDLAVRALQRLLDLAVHPEMVIEVRDDGRTRFEGVAITARRMFDRLPDVAREEWETQFREEAEALLERGLRLRRADDLRAVVRRFPAHDIRRRAHEALASLALSDGAFAEATYELRNLQDVARSPEEHAGVFARLAFAAAQSGDRAAVERIGMLIGTHGDEIVPGPEGAESLSAFLERMLEVAGPGAGTASWPSFSGSAEGTTHPETPPQPGAEAQWTAATRYQIGVETDNDVAYWGSPRPNRKSHRPVRPVVAQGVVYLNNGLDLRAIDLSSGRQLWRHASEQRSPQWRDNEMTLHTATVSDGVVYASLATRADAPDMDRVFYGRIIVYSLPHRALHALDAHTGEMLWSHDARNLRGHPDAEEISRESVASPPLVVGDDVLVTTWTWGSSFDVRLVCFDRHTGLTRWRRSIAQGQQELNLFGRPVKELATTPLAARDGVVYFATNLGIAAAVSLAHGEIRWLTPYAQTRIPPSTHWYQTSEREVTWRPSPVVATNQRVLIAPTESPYLFAFDPVDGDVVWSLPHRRGPRDYDHFLGVHDGKVYVHGTRIGAYSLEDGARAWNQPDAGRVQNSEWEETESRGAGVLCGDRIYVPTEDTIQIVESKTGGSEGMWLLPDPDGPGERTGGLVSADGALLLVTRRAIRAHYQFEQRRDRLLARIARTPDDPALRLEAGEIFRGAGQLDDAISSLEIGLKHVEGLAPRARERLEGPLRRALHATYVERAERSAENGSVTPALADLDRAVRVARDRDDAVRALLRISDLASGQSGERALERIRTEYGDTRMSVDGGGRVHAGALATLLLAQRRAGAGDVAGGLRLLLDLLESHSSAMLGHTDVRSAVHSRIAALREKHTADVEAAVSERARAALAAAREAADPDMLGRVARLYPAPQVAAEAAIEAARILMDRDDARGALALLRRAVSLDEVAPDVAARALWMLADAYRALDEASAELMTVQRLLRSFPTVTLDEELVSESAKRRLDTARLELAPRGLPTPKPPLEPLWEAVSTLDDGSPVPQIVVLEGRVPHALEGHILTSRGSLLEARSAENGREQWVQSIRVDRRKTVGTDNAVIVVGDERGRRQRAVQVQAYGAADGEPLWTQELPGHYRAAEAGLGVLYVLHETPDGAADGDNAVTAISLIGGEILGVRSVDGRMHREVTIADDAIVVYRAVTDSLDGPRDALTLDGATLALRGTARLDAGGFRTLSVHPKQSSVVVTLADSGILAGIDVGDGRQKWMTALPAGQVKDLQAISEAVIVTDTTGSVHRIDARSGEIVWSHDLSVIGELRYRGEAAGDGLVVATVVPPQADGFVLAVALDSESGDELWRRRVEFEGQARASPVLCAAHVAYEVIAQVAHREYRSRVDLLDRGDGRVVDTVEHVRIGRKFQTVVYDRGYVVLAVPGSLALYGSKK